MKAKMMCSVAFVTNILLGNVCMMPMAMAAEIPADCAHCSHHEEKKESAPQSSSCGGLCLSQAAINNTQGNLVVGSAQLLAIPSTPILIQWMTGIDIVLRPDIHASPPGMPTDSVVLRL
jgi:hypothetical protein